jgi:hypothetical protein
MDGSAHVAGPNLPFGHAIDLANARAKAVIGARRNIPPAMDGKSVPGAAIRLIVPISK